MKKSERLNDMMLFLNDKNVFQLSDIMTKYDISRSTAIKRCKVFGRNRHADIFGTGTKWSLSGAS